MNKQTLQNFGMAAAFVTLSSFTIDMLTMSRERRDIVRDFSACVVNKKNKTIEYINDKGETLLKLRNMDAFSNYQQEPDPYGGPYPVGLYAGLKTTNSENIQFGTTQSEYPLLRHFNIGNDAGRIKTAAVITTPETKQPYCFLTLGNIHSGERPLTLENNAGLTFK